MTIELSARAIDLALLQQASRFQLATPEGRRESAAWLANLYRQLLAATKPEVFLEIGAFSAMFSRSVRASLPNTEFHAIEANPHNFEAFRRDVETADVRYHHAAAGDSIGQVTFNVATEIKGKTIHSVRADNSVLTKPGVQYQSVTVPQTTVDHFASQNGVSGRRCSLWVDVEGLAYQVLDGCSRTLHSTDFVFIEVEEREFWAGQKLAGDVKRMMAGRGFFPIARDFEYGHQHNLIFTSGEAFDQPLVQKCLTEALSK
ncbi:FkbM family methyltransferase [Aurantimonas sp. VKM B-3413]|uniref:FkbM family methyltransferase n=1 Tax=Aurantimonas sp. VKM B-3413 TaxID=2779401 RepID=UPI001E2ECF19|nr:FkbM family methyltransferase [Aurantimonas sp. VKM B-3413]MCB8835931.1 FkbM family methyltransferase [Aurantimonas sp. VKM B-3413]